MRFFRGRRDPPLQQTGPAPRPVPISDEMIRLGQLLKLAGLVEDGAQARTVIAEGLVTVDGEVDTRRGAQVRPGSVVALGAERVQVVEDDGSHVDSLPW